MATTFQFSVLTPTHTFVDEQVQSIVVPGSEGYLGVLAHHAPLITALKEGQLKVTDAIGNERVYQIAGGFFEVSHNRAILLADAVREIAPPAR